MKFRMGESKFDVPQGTYRAKFLGVEESEHPEFGAGYKWQFEVVDQTVYRGKIAGRSTSKEPSLKNACGRMLQGLTGGQLAVAQEVDIEQFVGRVYTILVGPNSTGNGTRIETVLPLDANPAAQSAHTPVPPSRPGRATTPVSSTATPEMAMFWVDTGAEQPVRMSGAQVVALLNAATGPDEAEQIPVMSDDQKSGWQKPSFFGLKQAIPF